MLITYLRTKLPCLAPSLLVTAVSQKAKYNFSVGSSLSFLSLRKLTLIKDTYFWNICYYTKFQDPELSGTSESLTSEFLTVVMKALLIIEN